MPISDSIRQQVTERANGFCEYCLAPLAIIVEMQIDHIIPESAQGSSELENLCLACAGCNRYKLDFQVGTDPETGEECPLFNPRTQVWADHFAWNETSTQIIGLTANGRATITRLQMNRDRLVEARKYWLRAGWNS